jgi:phosphate transport system ATP-binding protein
MTTSTDRSVVRPATGAGDRPILPTVLKAEGVSVSYDGRLALKSTDMEIPARRVVALIGPSGCGKSTLLRSLNRMNDLVPGAEVEGKVLLWGKDIYDRDIDATDIRLRIGMVFQKPNPFPKSIYENVAFGLRVHGRKGDIGRAVQTSLERAGLWDEVKDRLADNALGLSGGQQQRLCIARALALEPEVLLMDEPCSALDPISTTTIEELIRDLRTHYTIVIVTHNMHQAARVSDYTAVMWTDEQRHGSMIEFGETSQVFGVPKDSRTEAYITGRVG